MGSVDLEGGRHLLLGQAPQSWRCPACGHANVSVLGVDACAGCGSGGSASAKHVGVDPIVRKGEKAAESLLTFKGAVIHETPWSPDLESAFNRWFGIGKFPPADLRYLRDAFEAGAKWQREQMTSPVTPLSENGAATAFQRLGIDPPPTFVPASDRERRTILAALKTFRENVLSQLGKDEIAAEEYDWLTPSEVDELITAMETANDDRAATSTRDDA